MIDSPQAENLTGATHELKAWPEFFLAVVSGEKRCEIRLNDRGYKVGDRLRLREYSTMKEAYTGLETWVRVTHVLDDDRFLQPGYVALSIVPDHPQRK